MNRRPKVEEIQDKEAGTYQFILMDVQMPRMNGYEATQKIRQFADVKKAQIPIIAMTANAFDEDRKKHWNAVWMDFYPNQLLLRN